MKQKNKEQKLKERIKAWEASMKKDNKLNTSNYHKPGSVNK